MRFPLVCPLVALAFTATAFAESREWTNDKGRKINADYVSQTATKVTVRLADGKEVVIEKAQLSKPDQEYLKTAGAGTPVPTTASPGAASSRPTGFNEVKIDKKTWVRHTPPKDLKVSAVDFTQQLETPHFFIAGSPKVKPDVMDACGESCERLYVHLLKYIPAVGPLFEGKRLSVWLTENEATHDKFGDWLNKRDGVEIPYTWKRSNIVHITFDEAYANDLKFLKGARSFRTDGKENQRNVKWGNRIYFITSEIFNSILDEVKVNGDYSLGLLRLGLCYFIEGDVCGNITTEISFAGSGSVEGFKNGRAWPMAIKNLLKNPNVKPGLEKLLKTDMTKAEPMDVGTAYGFYHWCFRDPARNAAFNTLLTTCVTDKKPPVPADFAKIFGFASVEAFDAAFVAYLKSDAFK